MRMMSGAGWVLGIAGILFALYLVVRKIFFGLAVPGWTTLMVTVLVLFGIQFFFLGVIGEYLWRTLDEARKRPAFIVDEIIESHPDYSRKEE